MIRSSKSNVRKTSNRRAHRPDQRIYRTMRLGGLARRRDGRLPLTLIAAGVVVAALLVVWILRR